MSRTREEIVKGVGDYVRANAIEASKDIVRQRAVSEAMLEVLIDIRDLLEEKGKKVESK